MLRLITIREVQLGFIIFIVAFLTLLFSEINVNMGTFYNIIIFVIAMILNIFFIQILIMLSTPKINKLKKMRDNNYYDRIFNVMFLFIYFAIVTLIIALIADVLGNERSYNILLLSMLMTSLYNLLISTMICVNYIRLSEDKKID